MLIKILCHDSEGHNDRLSFQSENVYETTAGEQNLPVDHSKMPTLRGPPVNLWGGNYHQGFPSHSRKLHHFYCHSTPLCFSQLSFTSSVFVAWVAFIADPVFSWTEDSIYHSPVTLLSLKTRITLTLVVLNVTTLLERREFLSPSLAFQQTSMCSCTASLIKWAKTMKKKIPPPHKKK